MFDSKLSAAKAFEPADARSWREQAERDLRGRPLESLRRTTPDGIAIEALYTRNEGDRPHAAPGAAPHRRGHREAVAALDLRTVVEIAELESARSEIDEHLRRGATSVLLRLAVDTDHGCTPGVGAWTLDEFESLTQPIDFEKVAVHLDAGEEFPTAAMQLAEIWRRRGVDPRKVTGGFGADPLGALARDGELSAGADTALARAADLARWTARNLVGVRALRVDADFVAHAGGTTAQQIGTLLACGVQMLRVVTAAGASAREALEQIEFAWRLDPRFFEQIAALRALRETWNRVAELSGEPDAFAPIHASTSDRVLTRRDPWVNILRGTSTTFAALVGGADAVGCAPFDAALGDADTLGRRVARNTVHVLARESHLARVADPAGGSWFLESLTDALGEKAWEFFREIENEGGALSVLRSGWLRERVDEAARQRSSRLATRKDSVTGVSEFPAADERPIERTRSAATPAVPESFDLGELPEAGDGSWTEAWAALVRTGASRADLRASRITGVDSSRRERIEPWPVRRDAEPFEHLRDASDAAAARAGGRPRAFVATLGPVAQHTARATWTANVLLAGGIEPVLPGPLDDLESCETAYAASGAAIAVLCSSDEIYADRAAETARALREAGARTVVLAGRPGDHEEEWRKAGVDRFVHVGVDVVDFLRALLDEEGVPS